jgi:outer membrane protein TolC
MKLVNVHTHLLLISGFLLFGQVSVAQESWTLQQCIDTALVQNRTLQMERNNRSIAEEQYREAKANLIPKLQAQAEYRYFMELPYQLMPMSIFGGPEGQFKEVQFGVPHNINASANLSLPLYDPQLYGGIAATNQARQIGQLQVRRTAEQVYFQVSELFYNAVILQQHMAFIDSNLVNVKKLVENVQLLHSEKMTTGTDVTRTQLQMAQLETDRQKLAAQLKNVLNMLKLNMGIAKDRALTIDHRSR